MEYCEVHEESFTTVDSTVGDCKSETMTFLVNILKLVNHGWVWANLEAETFECFGCWRNGNVVRLVGDRMMESDGLVGVVS